MIWGGLACGGRQRAAWGQQGAAREPQRGKSCRKESGNHQRGAQVLPGLSPAVPTWPRRAVLLVAAAAAPGDWQLGGPEPLCSRRMSGSDAGSRWLGWKPCGQEPTPAPGEGARTLVQGRPNSPPPPALQLLLGPGARDILTNDAACKTAPARELRLPQES